MANLAEPIGEAWMTGNESRFAGGPFSGEKLGDAWPAMPVEWKGTSLISGATFPLLIKFIFAEDKLSVQVHPDDEYASRHEQAAGGRGKTEMWYAVRARADAEVLVGLKPDVTRESFERAIADGTAENCLEHVPLNAGDAVFVPARTAHTIGSGLVLCEIQQNSDITYRVYDYNRRDAQGRARELHIEKALEVIRFGEQRGGKIRQAQINRGPVAETRLAECEYFATQRWEFDEPIEGVTSHEHFDVLIFLEGSGSIRWSANTESYGPAQVWLLPASLGKYELLPQPQRAGASPRTSLLRTYVPRAY
jgi:mannose-6-phosphate isomerase